MGVLLLGLLLGGLGFLGGLYLFRLLFHWGLIKGFLRQWLGVGGVGLITGLGGILGGLMGITLGRLLGVRLGFERREMGRSNQWVHDHIARYQHRRRQRLLRSREHVNVPDGALSRAQPPGKPTPTDAALSVADTTEEKDRLAASTDTSTEEVPLRQ